MTPESAKEQNEAYLKERGLPLNTWLPTLETMDELSPQDAQSAATRAVVLTYVIGLGFDQPAEKLKRPLVEFGLLDAASPKEKRLLGGEPTTQQEKIDCQWLVECVQSLGYCLGLVELDPFRGCDETLSASFPDPFADPRRFIESAELRPFDEIYLQADLHYRLHWAARNSRLTGEKTPLNEGMIWERRRALDWVIGVSDEWDEMPSDT